MLPVNKGSFTFSKKKLKGGGGGKGRERTSRTKMGGGVLGIQLGWVEEEELRTGP